MDPNQKHVWNIFALVKTVLCGDILVKGEGSSLNAEIGGSQSLRNAGLEFPWLTAV